MFIRELALSLPSAGGIAYIDVQFPRDYVLTLKSYEKTLQFERHVTTGAPASKLPAAGATIAAAYRPQKLETTFVRRSHCLSVLSGSA